MSNSKVLATAHTPVFEVTGTLQITESDMPLCLLPGEAHTGMQSIPFGRDIKELTHSPQLKSVLNGAQVRATVCDEYPTPRVIDQTLKMLPPFPCDVVSDESYLTIAAWMQKWRETIVSQTKEIEQKISEYHARADELDTKQKELKMLEDSLSTARRQLEEIEVAINGSDAKREKIAKNIDKLSLDMRILDDRKIALVSEIEQLDRKRRKLRDKVRSWVDAGWITEEEAPNTDPPIVNGGDLFAPNTIAETASYVDEIHRYIVHKCHLHYPRTLVENLFALIATHDTLVFAGTPGSGKTAFVRAFSEATSSIKETIIPVKPNWTSGEDLFGYWNPTAGHFVASDFTAAIDKAANNPSKLSLICLDEMNLARVEYYFADLLSALENRNSPEVPLIPDSVVQGISDEKKVQCLKYKKLKIPSNVRIIGCLNMDETTLGLSPKVLDRVHVVQFPDPLELPSDFAEKVPASNGLPRALDAEGFNRREYPPLLNSDPVCQQLAKWRDELAKIGMTLSPRSIRQAMHYRDCLARMLDEPLATWQTLNNTCLQKIVPRLERDMPDQVTAEARHESVKTLAQSFEKLSNEFSGIHENEKLESQAAASLRELYNAADKRPDKRYSVWK